MNAMNDFLAGAIFTAFLVVALFFLRFWRRTKDPLFIYFAAAFLLLAIERALMLAPSMDEEVASYVYVVRLVAFGLVIGGIVQKNRGR